MMSLDYVHWLVRKLLIVTAFKQDTGPIPRNTTIPVNTRHGPTNKPGCLMFYCRCQVRSWGLSHAHQTVSVFFFSQGSIIGEEISYCKTFSKNPDLSNVYCVNENGLLFQIFCSGFYYTWIPSRSYSLKVIITVAFKRIPHSQLL